MIAVEADVAVIGAGFAGSLTALVLGRMGLRPVLLERGTHPRFAIGESSTPVADFVLRRLAQKYNLPRLAPLTHYGSWRRTCPEIVCGLKRGFSYFHHRAGRPFEARPDHANELLVAASADDELADTHWFRADFDHFLVREAQNEGVPYFERVVLENLTRDHDWRLEGRAGEDALQVRAKFIIDASGEGMVMARRLGIPSDLVSARTNSRALYGHFTGVRRWAEVLASCGAGTADHPFPCDAAALHHVFEGGWMWVLRFDNGVTSAGFSLDAHAFPLVDTVLAEEEWLRLLKRFPSIGEQFEGAGLVPGCGLFRTGRLQRCAQQIAGEGWAMLPTSACRLDALHSTGNAHALCGVERLAGILEREWDRPRMLGRLREYERTVRAEFDLMDKMVHGSYLGFGRFKLMTDFAMLYFAAATLSEHRRREGTWQDKDAFLMAHDAGFRAAVDEAYFRLREVAADPRPPHDAHDRFGQFVRERIAPYNVAGLCDPAKRNMYPYIGRGSDCRNVGPAPARSATMTEQTPRVLDVGQCDMDHGAIAGMLQREFGAAVDRADTADEALAAIRQEQYDLVLVNRIFDHDGSEGLGLIQRLKADEKRATVPVMLVSNYEEAQDQAVAGGAVRGFGKAVVEAPETIKALAAHLQV